MNQWKSAHAVDTDKRTLAEALNGADAFLGLSVKGAVTKEMVKNMAGDGFGGRINGFIDRVF